MPSTLPQRLKAARKYANLRQQDIADACALAGVGVTRSAVAQWEYEDERRTQPSLDQVKAIARRTEVPLDLLLNDNADVADIWSGRAKSPKPMPLVSEPSSPVTDRLQAAYHGAIEFAVLQRAPELAGGFGQTIGQGWSRVTPDFLWNDTIVELKSAPLSADAFGTLLLAERVIARPLRKGIVELGSQSRASEEIYGVTVMAVASPDEAAKRIIAFCS